MALALFPLVSKANSCNAHGCVSTIENLYTTADGLIYIGTPADEKLVNCTAVSNVYLTLNPDSKNAKEVYSSLLAAYISKKKIQLRVKEGSTKCELAYVNLDVRH